jgi:hypothetical protein
MTLGRILGVLIFSSLVATGGALAGDISKNLANSKRVANVKGDKVPLKGAAAAVVVHHVRPEAPIVVGRSVSVHNKTKLLRNNLAKGEVLHKELEEILARLRPGGEQRVIVQHGSSMFCFLPMDPKTDHHVKVKPLDSNENLTSAEIGAIINRCSAAEVRA